MDTIDVDELRRDASDLVHRAARGEAFVITVDGRPSARLVPVESRTWREWSDISDLFKGPGDPAWNEVTSV